MVEQKSPREPGGTRMVMLLVLHEGIILERPLILKIKKQIKLRTSASHVPSVIAQVDELPFTFSAKLSERAVRDAVNKRNVLNAGALRNPECLQSIQNLPEIQLP